MKSFIFAILFAALFLPLQADEWLTNGDFSDGIHGWYGTAKSPADFAPPDPFTAADPFTAKGMIMQIHPDWTKECQDFKTKGTSATIKVTYVISKDLNVSSKAEDYENVTGSIGWGHWVPFKAAPKSFVIFVSDIQEGHYHAMDVQPDMGLDREQTAEFTVTGLTAWNPLTICLAFPPGSGMFVIHNVSVSGQ